MHVELIEGERKREEALLLLEERRLRRRAASRMPRTSIELLRGGVEGHVQADLEETLLRLLERERRFSRSWYAVSSIGSRTSP